MTSLTSSNIAPETRLRRLPIGAEPGADGVHFRVWAPKATAVDVVLEGLEPAVFRLAPEGSGYFSGLVEAAGIGTLYRYRLDGGRDLYADPASRFQPEGPHGPSRVIDSRTFQWNDQAWPGVGPAGQVIYELHVGTFTGEGTFAAATRELAELAALGVTVLEVMPIADFPGQFGWGYDGVNAFSPSRLYGEPDDVRRFVDTAHRVGLGVILDVVYNHFGPDGNYLSQFSDAYVTDRYECDWGQAINFDGDDAGPVREFFLANAAYWIDEFHLDGLRLDATQQIFDASPEHILAAIGHRVRAAADGRATFIVAENERQHTTLVRPVAAGGCGLDALWNDDFHHAARVALTGHHEAYYSDYRGDPQEFISAMKWGYLYQGQRYSWQEGARGTPALDLAPAAFVNFIQNHDQVANSGRGERLHALADPGRLKAITALLLLGPGTPMLFMGQEFAATGPFLYFADHGKELGLAVRTGRRDFLKQFPTLATAAMRRRFADPADPATFQRCKLDFGDRKRHAEIYALHRDLLRLRRDDPVFGVQRPRGVDGAVLGPEAFVLRFFGQAAGDRLLLVNLGRDLTCVPAPEPLLAPPAKQQWSVLWSSEDPRYGGNGTAAVDCAGEGWSIPGHAAIVLAPVEHPLTRSRS